MGDAKHPIRKLGGAPALPLLLPIVWMTDLMKGSGSYSDTALAIHLSCRLLSV